MANQLHMLGNLSLANQHIDETIGIHPCLLPIDAMATEEWKKEVQKHEQYIKDLEQKYSEKCKELKVVNLDYAEKSVFFP